MDVSFFDVERVIAEKNPKLLKRLPGFVLSYLKKILHQDEINAIVRENASLKNEAFCREIIQRFNLKLLVSGLENVPPTGGLIMVGNHPLGGMDALTMVDALSHHRTDIKFIVNDILLNLKNLEDLFVGVNKHGGNAASSLQQVDDVFSGDKMVFIFPAGLVSRKIHGKVEDLHWKKTFITRAKKYEKSVIPVFIDGKLSNFFYGLARFRQFLGIKANIEMLFLINELFKQKNQTIRITFGKPLPHTTFDGSKTDQNWADWVKKEVYKLQA
ncbi:MAG: 1-acyl-sn-glycerol-3-phosphate acyltransferase [Flavobacteriales bacterium]|nr:1-acyl-sn-glycerol-3-phosphate acyltransferase [Flavobacteriales bacterium]